MAVLDPLGSYVSHKNTNYISHKAYFYNKKQLMRVSQAVHHVKGQWHITLSLA
jgi:hypothetical protein